MKCINLVRLGVIWGDKCDESRKGRVRDPARAKAAHCSPARPPSGRLPVYHFVSIKTTPVFRKGY